MTKPTSVAIAEQMLARFERDRAALVERRATLAEQRSGVADDAHAGDGPATKLLDGLTREAVEIDAKIAAADDAIAEARRRLEQARVEEARQQDREKVLALRQALTRFVDAGKDLDAALKQLVTSSTAIRDALTAMNRLGCSHPSHAQLDSLGALAIRTAMTSTSWSRYFERVGPMERKTFAALVATWSTMVERQIASRLGDDSPEAA
jgi:hypothetical protein